MMLYLRPGGRDAHSKLPQKFGDIVRGDHDSFKLLNVGTSRIRLKSMEDIGFEFTFFLHIHI